MLESITCCFYYTILRNEIPKSPRQSAARELIRELGVLYYPDDLQQGQTQPVERVAERFQAVWSRLKVLAEAADLHQRACERLAKAERLSVQLLATIVFFFATVTARVEALRIGNPSHPERPGWPKVRRLAGVGCGVNAQLRG
jgi:hypothetical protein